VGADGPEYKDNRGIKIETHGRHVIRKISDMYRNNVSNLEETSLILISAKETYKMEIIANEMRFKVHV
jgi:hypothetical protein